MKSIFHAFIAKGLHIWLQLLAIFVVINATIGLEGAFAQAGPPMVTDDPDTPGDGKWEINLSRMSSLGKSARVIYLPDVDLNYGWGEHLQLKADIPFAFGQTNGFSTQQNWGTSNFGVKWRFIDEPSEDLIADDTFRFNLSTYPQFQTSLSSKSVKQGLSSPDQTLYLPIEASGHWSDDMEIYGGAWVAEFGHSWTLGGASHDTNNQVGLMLARNCSPKIECLGELHGLWQSRSFERLVNLGFRYKINDAVKLMGSVGIQNGQDTLNHFTKLSYLGLQFNY